MPIAATVRKPENTNAEEEAALHLPYRQDLSAAGLDAATLAAQAEMLASVLDRLRTAPPVQAAAIFATVQEDGLADLVKRAEQWRAEYKHLVVIGAGGSGLSAQALSLLKPVSRRSGDSRLLHVLDNLDPPLLEALVHELPLHDTCFLAVSKSGRTVETYAQTLLLLAQLKQQGVQDIHRRFLAITAPGDNPLRALADAHGVEVMAHDPDLGGRFSILSAAGVIPAAFMGIDARRLRAGAAAALRANLASCQAPAALGAIVQVAHMRQGRNISVLLSYSAQLWGLALWWRQSWAESLGKNGQGSTPLAALGPVDQHSQLQLWLDGPEGKFYTVLSAASPAGAIYPEIPLPEVHAPFAHLSGRHLSDIVEAQRRATEETLARYGRPLRRMHVPRLDEYALGALIMHFTLEILLSAALLGVNPFDQPAVEESKRLAHAYLTGKI